jgi:hypothetical protein
VGSRTTLNFGVQCDSVIFYYVLFCFSEILKNYLVTTNVAEFRSYIAKIRALLVTLTVCMGKKNEISIKF